MNPTTPQEAARLSNNPHLNTALSLTKRYIRQLWLALVRLWKWAAYAIGSVVLAIVALIVVVSLASDGGSGMTTANEQYISGSGANKIAVVPIEGIIGQTSPSVFGGGVGLSADLIRTDLNQAQNDPTVKAIILSINSPGGSAVVSDQIYQHITQFKHSSNKPVIASLGDTAASGGYYIAAAADKIVANPASLTGSIGVIMEFYDASGLLRNIGVSPEVVKSGTYKDMGSFTRPATDEERAILQSVVDEAYGQFVDRVAEGRNMERETVMALADGRIYTGSQAKDKGLVDELGNLNVAVDLAKDFAGINQASVVKYTHGGWWDSVLSVTQSLQPLSALNKLASTPTVGGLQYRWAP